MYFTEHYRLLKIKKQENWFQGNDEVVTGQFVIASGSKFSFIYALPGIITILIIFAVGIFYYPPFQYLSSSDVSLTGCLLTPDGTLSLILTLLPPWPVVKEIIITATTIARIGAISITIFKL